MPKHYEELLIYMRDEPFDILTLNETRLDGSILDCEVQIPGYDIIRSDRNRYGGGVAIYIRTISFHISYVKIYYKILSNCFVLKLENPKK